MLIKRQRIKAVNFIDEKIDTGRIIFQETLPIIEDETAGEVHDKLMELGFSPLISIQESFIRTIQHIIEQDK